MFFLNFIVSPHTTDFNFFLLWIFTIFSALLIQHNSNRLYFYLFSFKFDSDSFGSRGTISLFDYFYDFFWLLLTCLLGLFLLSFNKNLEDILHSLLNSKFIDFYFLNGFLVYISGSILICAILYSFFLIPKIIAWIFDFNIFFIWYKIFTLNSIRILLPVLLLIGWGLIFFPPLEHYQFYLIFFSIFFVIMYLFRWFTILLVFFKNFKGLTIYIFIYLCLFEGILTCLLYKYFC